MWHAIATTTVLPSLKSARKYCDEIRTPVFIHSGDIIDCYKKVLDFTGAETHNDILDSAKGLPICQNEHWTYWLVQDKN
jgi:hypothetical protein